MYLEILHEKKLIISFKCEREDKKEMPTTIWNRWALLYYEKQELQEAIDQWLQCFGLLETPNFGGRNTIETTDL